MKKDSWYILLECRDCVCICHYKCFRQNLPRSPVNVELGQTEDLIVLISQWIKTTSKLPPRYASFMGMVTVPVKISKSKWSIFTIFVLLFHFVEYYLWRRHPEMNRWNWNNHIFVYVQTAINNQFIFITTSTFVFDKEVYSFYLHQINPSVFVTGRRSNISYTVSAVEA